MTRPVSYRDQTFERRCETCKHCRRIEFKDDMLCLYMDEYTVQPSFVRDGWDDVVLNGEPVGLMEGDEYDAVWGGRVVDSDSVCDEWEEKR